MMLPPGKVEQFMDTKPLTRCIHCKAPTAGMCPRCRAYSCVRQHCIDTHDAKCKEFVFPRPNDGKRK